MCRTPQHSLRVSSLNGHTAGGLMAALSQRESVAVSRSVLLPDEFLCVHSGLHLVLRDFVANGSCMVDPGLCPTIRIHVKRSEIPRFPSHLSPPQSAPGLCGQWQLHGRPWMCPTIRIHVKDLSSLESSHI